MIRSKITFRNESMYTSSGRPVILIYRIKVKVLGICRLIIMIKIVRVEKELVTRSRNDSRIRLNRMVCIPDNILSKMCRELDQSTLLCRNEVEVDHIVRRLRRHI